MTSGGDIKLTFHIYKLSFLNFLLGRQPNGPGQFIFGCVDTSQFSIDRSNLEAGEAGGGEADLTPPPPYCPRPRRESIFV